MIFERYTEKARRVIFFARYEASQLGAPHIETEHVLLGLLRETAELLYRLLPDVQYEPIRREVAEHSPFQKATSVTADLHLSNECKRVLAYAAEEAERLRHHHIGTEHLLLGLLREKKSYAAQLLQQHGADLADLRSRIAELPKTWEDTGEHSFQRDKPLTEPVRIHGAAFDPRYVEEAVRDCRRFLWQIRAFVAPDLVVRSSDGAISFDKHLAEHGADFRLVEGGWNEVTCVICRWQLQEGDDPERNTGYTNGRDWLCIECYEGFLKPGSTQEAG